MSHPTDEIPEPASPVDESGSPEAPPASPTMGEPSVSLEIEEQTPDGGRPGDLELTAAASSGPAPEPEPEPEPVPVPVAAPAATAAPPPPNPDDDEPPQLVWYVLKVQSSREDTIRDALERRVKIQGLDRYFGRIVVPTEKITEIRNNKKKVVERKSYPGYIMVEK